MKNNSKTQINKNTLAKDLVDFAANIESGQEFSKDTLHLFCSPLFVRAMENLFDKNIVTTSCGSGRERNILPGITGLCDKLSDENKVIAKDMLISSTEFRIGAEIKDTTTAIEFENSLVKIVDKFKPQ